MGNPEGGEKRDGIIRAAACVALVLLVSLAGRALWRPAVPAQAGVAWQSQRELPQPEPLMVNVNTAGEQELQELPGIGEALARRIVQEREANGPFSEAADLQRVEGIGEGKLSAIADFITTE